MMVMMTMIVMMMMADSSQTRVLGKVEGQFLHARLWLQGPILDAQTPLHFGRTKVWVEEDWEAARSFCLLRFSFAASCLSASNLRFKADNVIVLKKMIFFLNHKYKISLASCT